MRESSLCDIVAEIGVAGTFCCEKSVGGRGEYGVAVQRKATVNPVTGTRG